MFNRFKSAWNAFFFKPKASNGYNAGGSGRRAQGWNASPLGPNALHLANLPVLIKRSRDAVRNSSIARSAIDKWESNVVGTGIQPHFMHPDPEIKKALQVAWTKWAEKSPDYAGQLSFYGQQALVARELFEAGECFARFHVVPQEGSVAPLQVQLIESEQLPVYQGLLKSEHGMTKMGIVFDENDQRVGYEMYKGQPFDIVDDPIGAGQTIFIPSKDVLHVMKPLRAGQLRGEPQMTAVLTLLRELEDYADSERMRKKVATMFAGFLEKPSPEGDVLPVDLTGGEYDDPGTQISKLEPGTIQELGPGEKVEFPDVPEAGDYSAFMKAEIHKFAAGCGLTYEQVTGDLEGVNYSSIRAGLLEFRRSAEQFQENIIIKGFCQPTLRRWLKEAILSGALELPDNVLADYHDDPSALESCIWVTPGWDWVDPQKEILAAQMAVRNGFIPRSMVIRQLGYDPDIIDAQIAEERKRANKFGLVFDSDPNQVLLTGKPNMLPDEEDLAA